MDDALQAKDADRLASLTHALVGSLGNFAAAAATQRAKTLERKARAGEIDDCRVVYAEVAKMTRRLTESLESFVAGEGA